jgi:peptidoglycan/xylan/chitin deacetylase (PgdA/CDA1 family)
MYHSISEEEERGTPAYFRIHTAPQVFAEHLKFLHDNSYTVIGLDEATSILSGGSRSPEKPVVLTFDDGYRDFHLNAFRALREFSAAATVFLPTAFIGAQRRTFKGQECLTWNEVRELHRSGISFGSHTLTHPDLRAVTDRQLWRELSESKDTIEQELGAAVTSFAYPYAFPQRDRGFRRVLGDVLQQCGYRCGVSTILGTASRGEDLFAIRRLPINSADDRAFFSAKLEGGYDWLRHVQSGVKGLKSRPSRIPRPLNSRV